MPNGLDVSIIVWVLEDWEHIQLLIWAAYEVQHSPREIIVVSQWFKASLSGDMRRQHVQIPRFD